ncbi:M48 family metalloprotease [Natronomonas gomsonensis]|uniref:M48 family metalloprotease n=1 Tax=Natronomonas gomsonensis TaxID=1046043 RepID=UPI0015BDC252|nr:M48 family metalloprotease [Natronomonas gomsonensis]
MLLISASEEWARIYGLVVGPVIASTAFLFDRFVRFGAVVGVFAMLFVVGMLEVAKQEMGTDLMEHELAPLVVLTVLAVAVCSALLYSTTEYFNNCQDRSEIPHDAARPFHRVRKSIRQGDTFDTEAAERWSADPPGKTRIRILTVLGVGYPVVAGLLIAAPETFRPGAVVLSLGIGISLGLRVSGTTPVRPVAEHVAFSLGGALLAVALWPLYFIWILLSTATFLPLWPHLLFPVVGGVSTYCLLLADDAVRVRRGTYPTEAEPDLADANLPKSESAFPSQVLARLPDPSLRVRLLATLLVVVLLNLSLFVGLGGIVYHVAAALGLAVPVGVLAVLLPVAAVGLLLVEAGVGKRRALEAEEVADERLADVEARVRRLAHSVEVPPPDVVIIDSPEPNSLSTADGREPTIAVTTGLLDELDGEELQAVLAHEIAHIANRDTTVATVAAAISELSRALRRRERRFADWFRLFPLLFASPVLLVLLAPALLAIPVYIAVSTATRGLLAVNGVCMRFHARAREYAADRTAVRLVGQPGALASALETLGPEHRPTTDARLAASATLGIVSRPIEGTTDAESVESKARKWFPKQFEQDDTPTSRFLERVNELLTWRPTTHPSNENRIRRLRNEQW